MANVLIKGLVTSLKSGHMGNEQEKLNHPDFGEKISIPLE